jgi:hypothetical protein
MDKASRQHPTQTNPASAVMYLRGFPQRLAREAKAAAARRGITLAEFVREAVASHLTRRQHNQNAADEIVAGQAWYEHHRAQVSRKYAGQYVAITNGGVLDHDSDFDALSRRVYDRLGFVSVFMPKVGAEGVLHVRSPRMRA